MKKVSNNKSFVRSNRNGKKRGGKGAPLKTNHPEKDIIRGFTT